MFTILSECFDVFVTLNVTLVTFGEYGIGSGARINVVYPHVRQNTPPPLEAGPTMLSGQCGSLSGDCNVRRFNHLRQSF